MAKKKLSEKILPHNIEAEQALLAACLIDDAAVGDVVDMMSPEDFYKPRHQAIFSAISDIFRSGGAVDLITTAHRLEETGDTEQAGGVSYLAELIDECPAAVNAPHYARIIRDRSMRRQLILRAREIALKAYDTEGETEELIDWSEKKILDVATMRSGGFVSLESLLVEGIDRLEKRWQQKSPVTGVATGFSDLDELTSGFQPGNLVILAARPSMGKTSLALQVAANVASKGKAALFFSLEMSQEELGERLLISEARVNSVRMRNGYFQRDEWQRMSDTAERLHALPLQIDDSADVGALDIRARSRRIQRRMGLDVGAIFVDYLQILRRDTKLERRDLEIADASMQLKALAKELRCPVVALSQLNRKLEERGDKRPKLSDLRESGALEQDADVVIFVYRDEVYNGRNSKEPGVAEILVSKQRNGATGRIKLHWAGQHMRYSDLAKMPDHQVA